MIGRLLWFAAVAVALPTPSLASSRSQALSARASLAQLSASYLDALASFHPSSATALGDHRFDDRLTDFSDISRARWVDFCRNMLSRVRQLHDAPLNLEERVDAELLEQALRQAIWTEEELQSWQWDPQIYNEAAGSALYSLAARDFAPWRIRLKAATARMERMPALFAQARSNLIPARVSPIGARTAADRNAGLKALVERMLVPHKGSLTPAEARRFAAAIARLNGALAEHQQWLNETLVTRARGNFRLGAKLYDQKLKFSLNTQLSRQQIKQRAEQSVVATRAEMYTIARRVLQGQLKMRPLPAHPNGPQEQAAIEAALEMSYAKRPARTNLVSGIEEALRATTAFVRNRRLVTLPKTRLTIMPMPEYLQGTVVMACYWPGPLEPTLDTLLMVSPIPAAWSEERAANFLREYNEYMIHDLAIHEAMPGHYVQAAHANDHASRLRAVLWSNSLVEGWAVYAEGMMADAGYLQKDPLFRLTVLKTRLRSVMNALLDIGVHTEGMTQDQAMQLLKERAFQQPEEAERKWVRATTTSAQLPSYFVGYTELMEMREEAKQRQGAAFSLRAFNDSVLSHGAAPPRYLRSLMLGSPIKRLASKPPSPVAPVATNVRLIKKTIISNYLVELALPDDGMGKVYRQCELLGQCGSGDSVER